MALVIGYLPTLYSAYDRRELQLLALDDLPDEPTTPVTFIEASYANGGAQGVAAAFADWERWCDEVFDTHTAYPMPRLYEQAWDQYRRLREAFYPELAAATRLLLVPMEFRHHTSRLYLSGPPGP